MVVLHSAKNISFFGRLFKGDDKINFIQVVFPCFNNPLKKVFIISNSLYSPFYTFFKTVTCFKSIMFYIKEN